MTFQAAALLVQTWLMCGRFVVARATADLVSMFDVMAAGDNLPEPAWNIKPTNWIPVVLESAKGQEKVMRRLEAGRWSLTPSYSKELKTKFATFNARSETAAEKATFRGSVKNKRAILPADFYYEWHTEGKTKTPYAIHSPNNELLGFAGLYTWWPDKRLPEDHRDYWTLTATILTRAAVGEVSQLHDRTPVTLPASFWDEWLDAGQEGDQTLVDAAVAAATPVAEALEFHQVAPLRGDGPELVKPISS